MKKSIHGVYAGLNQNPIHKKGSGTWKDISKIVVNMHMKQLIPHSVMKRNIGNGENTFFWLDPWVGSLPLMVAYPRLYALDVNKFFRLQIDELGTLGFGTGQAISRLKLEQAPNCKIWKA